ncbi:uncharacterized protein METZ01_LOCUS278355, partial [marine metagenome]
LIVVENPKVGQWGGVVAAPAFQRTLERILHISPLEQRFPEMAERRAGRGETLALVPDLRGLRPDHAIRHASRRGVPLRLEGQGELVVAQDPVAMSVRSDGGGTITCYLGDRNQIHDLGIAETPRRQAVLLRKLSSGNRLAAVLR